MRKILILSILVLIVSSIGLAQGASSQLEMEVFEAEPDPLQSGQYADLWIRVTNTGDLEASDPYFELVDKFPFTPTDKAVWRPNGALGPGESYTIRAQVKVSENAVFGENDVRFLKSSDGGETTFSEDLTLGVRADDRSLIVSDLEFPEKIVPGGTGTMTVELKNNAQSVFRNIDVSLDTSDIPVATRETSRERISSIGPQQSESVSYTLDVDEDAENQLHDLPLTITYEDQAGNEYEVTETTGVNIGGYPDLDVAIEESDIRSQGQGTVTFRIINKGQGEARFTELSINETDQFEILSEDSIYLGSMISDDFQTAEFELYVSGNESIEFPANLRYSDGTGEKSQEFEINRELYSSSELERYGLTSSGGSGLFIVLLILGASAGIIYWRRRE